MITSTTRSEQSFVANVEFQRWIRMLIRIHTTPRARPVEMLKPIIKGRSWHAEQPISPFRSPKIFQESGTDPA